MSYMRVIPRDLFNEANLLKCYGRIFINLDTANLPGVVLSHDDEPFDIQMNEDDGSLSVGNVILMIGDTPCRLWRPMNARGEWPLYLANDDSEDIQVFNVDGTFTAEFVTHLCAGAKNANELKMAESAAAIGSHAAQDARPMAPRRIRM